MNFIEYLDIKNHILNESADKVAKKFVSDCLNNKIGTFEFTAIHYKTGEIQSRKVKINLYESFNKLSGGTKMIENSDVLKMIHGDKTAINEWKNWLLKEAFSYTFDASSLSFSRIRDIILEEAYPGKDSWHWKITSLSYDGINFFTKK